MVSVSWLTLMVASRKGLRQRTTSMLHLLKPALRLIWMGSALIWAIISHPPFTGKTADVVSMFLCYSALSSSSLASKSVALHRYCICTKLLTLYFGEEVKNSQAQLLIKSLIVRGGNVLVKDRAALSCPLELWCDVVVKEVENSIKISFRNAWVYIFALSEWINVRYTIWNLLLWLKDPETRQRDLRTCTHRTGPSFGLISGSEKTMRDPFVFRLRSRL
jgi:hypothetical protein